MGNALLRTISRFGIWAVAIWGVSKALSFVYEQMERKKLGQYTFFDWLMGETRIAALEVKILGAELDLMYANSQQAVRNLLSLGIRDSVGLNPQQTPQQQAIEKNKNRSTSGKGGGVLGLGNWRSSNNIPIPSNSNQPVQFTARNVSVYTDGNGRNTIKVDGGQVSLPYIG